MMAEVNDVSFVIYNLEMEKFLSSLEPHKVLTPRIDWSYACPLNFNNSQEAIDKAKQLIKRRLVDPKDIIVLKLIYFINEIESVIDTYSDFSDPVWVGLYDN